MLLKALPVLVSGVPIANLGRIDGPREPKFAIESSACTLFLYRRAQLADFVGREAMFQRKGRVLTRNCSPLPLQVAKLAF